MTNRNHKLVLICDNDPDNSFALEGELRNRNYDVVVINDATGLEGSARSLQPAVVLANPDMKGFNEYDICKSVKTELNIPLIFLVDKHSTHRAGLNRQSTHAQDIGDCSADDVVEKPVQVVDNVINLIEKHRTMNQNNA